MMWGCIGRICDFKDMMDWNEGAAAKSVTVQGNTKAEVEQACCTACAQEATCTTHVVALLFACDRVVYLFVTSFYLGVDCICTASVYRAQQ